MISKAIIYNPYTGTKNYYTESIDSRNISLEISNFNNSKATIFFIQSEPFVDLGELKLKTSCEESTEKQHFINYVKSIVSEIKLDNIQKVVAAQKQVYEYKPILNDLLNVVELLIEKFPKTFVYLYYIDQTIWIGASPEIVGIYENDLFKTISLAGTTYDTSPLFYDKEQKEQDVVSKYIHTLLSEYGKNVITKPKEILKYGNLQHLVNEFSIEMPHANDFNELVHEIHPSPALSGLPKEDSIDYILQNEGFDRDYYCGLTIIENSDIEKYSFAHIRCAQITQHQIIYYGGAGITEDSIPEMEYIETTKKIESLKHIIENDLNFNKNLKK